MPPGRIKVKSSCVIMWRQSMQVNTESIGLGAEISRLDRYVEMMLESKFADPGVNFRSFKPSNLQHNLAMFHSVTGNQIW